MMNFIVNMLKGFGVLLFGICVIGVVVVIAIATALYVGEYLEQFIDIDLRLIVIGVLCVIMALAGGILYAVEENR